jgi:hypothetical protein
MINLILPTADEVPIVVATNGDTMYVCMYVCMYKRWAMTSGPCTATFNDLLMVTLGSHVKSPTI